MRDARALKKRRTALAWPPFRSARPHPEKEKQWKQVRVYCRANVDVRLYLGALMPWNVVLGPFAACSSRGWAA